MKKTYLFIINPETGERKATYLVGIHGTLEQVQEKATAEYPDDLHIVSEGEEMFNALVGQNKLYKNGQLVDRPPYVPTEEELLQAAKQPKLQQLQQLLNSTDYKAIKYAEGVLPEEEYAPVKALRQAWRDAYNEIESATDVDEVEAINWPED